MNKIQLKKINQKKDYQKKINIMRNNVKNKKILSAGDGILPKSKKSLKETITLKNGKKKKIYY
jgi:hypothetical protein